MRKEDFEDLPSVLLPLTTGSKEKKRVPSSSGLNWGQRPGREQNQAYLAIPSELQRNGFFPNTGEEFLITTDDGHQWKCARRQANGKAIHTVENNSIIGKYFRNRLNLELGDLVTISHLIRYGRTSVSIYKKSSYSFILDYSAEH